MAKKKTNKKHTTKYPLKCQSCGTVARAEFAEEPCPICGGQWKRRNKK